MSALLIPLLGGACADVSEIEDGAKSGSLVTLKDWFTSCQLLVAGDAVVLFDACFRKGSLRRSLAEHGLEPGDVTHVLLTHGHGDHVGGLEVLSSAEIAALPGERETFAEEELDIVIDRELTDGETLTFGSSVVRVLAMPGHTPGSAAFWVDGALVLGDAALVNSGGELVPVPEDRSSDPEGAEQSLAALHQRLVDEALPVDWLLPAHSGRLQGLAGLAAFAQTHGPVTKVP